MRGEHRVREAWAGGYANGHRGEPWEMDVDGCRYGCPDHLRIAWAWQAHGLCPGILALSDVDRQMPARKPAFQIARLNHAGDSLTPFFHSNTWAWRFATR